MLFIFIFYSFTQRVDTTYFYGVNDKIINQTKRLQIKNN